MNAIFKSALSASIDRLKERSTWRGIVVGVAGLFGATVGAEYIEAITGVALAAVGVVEIVFREHGYFTD